jgi:hypothetical protein
VAESALSPLRAGCSVADVIAALGARGATLQALHPAPQPHGPVAVVLSHERVVITHIAQNAESALPGAVAELDDGLAFLVERDRRNP